MEDNSDSGRTTSVRRAACQSPPSSQGIDKIRESALRRAFSSQTAPKTPSCSVHYLSRNSSIVLTSAEEPERKKLLFHGIESFTEGFIPTTRFLVG
ncbi:hypothetical protein CRG98_043651 [Punica granatum]|uniref:Uncharacterized protein n=1 Tax=Punica granatum TaxID=22663 RepID=A0A2I0HW83_PUNGR|nr:hypothetical protein CRG98_043651 [Punica granatum]